ncbi:proteasome subunit beta type-11-like [Gadus macrocephalus]|uniref:proteasome subunit beta type-11-like n=1 Tax=Gadus macrocephalus TaxID=80720 RepID=UPI0028CB6DFA|nr:proteasome subunit beta type-11-like [Gadus macrocephalus]
MALEDLCGLQALGRSLRGSLGGLTPDLGPMGSPTEKRRGRYAGDVPLSSTASVLSFSVPVGRYLDRSPIDFGQTAPDYAPTPDASRWSAGGPGGPDFAPGAGPDSSPGAVPLPFPTAHGTTTLGFLFQGGVLAAADTRSSCSGLVACPASRKVVPLHRHLLALGSGTSADIALWRRILARELRLYQLRHGRRLTTGGAAKLLALMLHPFKGTELCVAATLCGWDGEPLGAADLDPQLPALDWSGQGGAPALGGDVAEAPARAGPPGGGAGTSRGGARLYYVCSDGKRLRGELFSVGSGSPYAYSVLDEEVRWGLSVEQAARAGREAVYRASRRDAYSGNCVDVFLVTARGWSRRPREDLGEEYYREQEGLEEDAGGPSARPRRDGSKLRYDANTLLRYLVQARVLQR